MIITHNLLIMFYVGIIFFSSKSGYCVRSLVSRATGNKIAQFVLQCILNGGDNNKNCAYAPYMITLLLNEL